MAQAPNLTPEQQETLRRQKELVDKLLQLEAEGKLRPCSESLANRMQSSHWDVRDPEYHVVMAMPPGAEQDAAVERLHRKQYPHLHLDEETARKR